jgi:hypothetical protein
VPDKIDEIIEMLTRSAREGGRDHSYITREYVYKMLSDLNETAQEFIDDLLRSRAHAAAMTYATPEERARILQEMPACTLIRLYGPGDGSIDPEFEAAGVYERAKRELEEEIRQANTARKSEE